MNKLLFYILILIATAAISCSNEFKVKSISVYPENLELPLGDSVRVTAVINFSGGDYNDPDLIHLKWNSNNSDIATVDTAGLVKAKNIGNTTITVECENVTAQCAVNVTDTIAAEQYFMQTIL